MSTVARAHVFGLLKFELCLKHLFGLSNDLKKSSSAIFSLLVSLENQPSTINGTYCTLDSFFKSVDCLFIESIKVDRFKRLIGENVTSVVS